MKKQIIAFCLLLNVAMLHAQNNNSSASAARQDNNKDMLLGLNLAIPFPAMTKLVQNNMGNMGFGLSGLFLVNPFGKKSSPLRLGGEVGYTYFGRFKTDVTVNGYYGDYKTSYGIITLHGVLRIKPPHLSRVVPFADIYAGGNFYVSTIKENLGFIESSLGIQSFDLGGELNASFSRGLAVGLSIGKPESGQSRFVFRACYTVGSNLRYIVRNSLQYDNTRNTLTYQTGTAPVKYIMLQFGIGL